MKLLIGKCEIAQTFAVRGKLKTVLLCSCMLPSLELNNTRRTSIKIDEISEKSDESLKKKRESLRTLSTRTLRPEIPGVIYMDTVLFRLKYRRWWRAKEWLTTRGIYHGGSN